MGKLKIAKNSTTNYDTTNNKRTCMQSKETPESVRMHERAHDQNRENV